MSERSHAAGRGVAPRAVALAIALAVALAVAAAWSLRTTDSSPHVAGAAPGRGPVGTAAAAEAPSNGVALVDQTDWLRDGEVFVLDVALGPGVGPDDSLVVDLHDPVTSRSQFTATLDGSALGSRRQELVVPVGELGDRPDGSRRLRLTPAPTETPGERPLPSPSTVGVHPLVVGVRPADAAVAAPPSFTTYLVRSPEVATTRLRVAVIQPIESPLAQRPDGDVDLDPVELDRLAGVAALLAATTDTPLSLVVRPETTEALAALSLGEDERAERAQAVLDDVGAAGAGRQVVSTPLVEIDLDALEAAGLGEEVATQRRRGDQVLGDLVGLSTEARTWVEDDGVTRPALRRLAGLGVDRIVVPDAALGPTGLPLTLARPFALGVGGETSELTATVADPGLAAHHRTSEPVLGAQHLLADLAVLHGDRPGPRSPRGIVVAPPDDVATDPVLLAALLDGLAGSPILAPVTLDDYFDQVEPEGGLDHPLVRDLGPGGPSLGITPAAVADARAKLAGYATAVGAGQRALRDLADPVLLAQADGLTLGERRRYLAAVGDEVDARLGSVRVVDSATFRLPDREGTIPLTIVRDEGEPLDVRVTLASDKLAFSDDPRPDRGVTTYELTLEASNTPLVVPVRARSTGTFPMLVTIATPDGRIELGRSQVTIRSTAVPGLGVALSAGAGLFLALWWGRHWRTVRRDRRLVPAG